PPRAPNRVRARPNRVNAPHTTGTFGWAPGATIRCLRFWVHGDARDVLSERSRGRKWAHPKVAIGGSGAGEQTGSLHCVAGLAAPKQHVRVIVLRVCEPGPSANARVHRQGFVKVLGRIVVVEGRRGKDSQKA